MNSELIRISEARQALAEAKSLPDIRRVMEAASVAVTIAKKQAKLAEGQQMAAEVVKAAEEAANDAAIVRIEAQAKAGEMLRSMAERGERTTRQTARSNTTPVLDDLGVSPNDSSRWQRVADVPEPVRQEYVEEARAQGGEITTTGLLRHAEERAADRWAQMAPVPSENRYRLELSKLAEQAGRIAEYDPEEAARLADEGTALSLETVPATWAEWMRKFQRARSGLHLVRNEP